MQTIFNIHTVAGDGKLIVYNNMECKKSFVILSPLLLLDYNYTGVQKFWANDIK